MKKQKKGFTLIELLATIIILGLLVTIAYISVTSILNRGNDSYYESQENMLLLAGREYFADHRSELPKDIGNTSNVSLETLIKEKYIDKVKDKTEDDCDDEKSGVTVQKITDKDYQYYVTLVCNNYETKGDKTKPIIKFSPNENSSTNNITVKMEVTDNKEVESYRYVIIKDGEEYKDSGYQNYTGEITIELTEKGLYEIVGYAYDSSGNKNSKRSGKYSIHEGIDCSKVEFTSNINASTWTNKDITVGMKLPDNTYKWELSKRVDEGEYSLVGNYIGVTDGNLTLNTEGKHQLKLVLYDNEGHSCIATSEEYYIDKTAPTCESSGGSTSWTSKNVTLKGKCKDSGSGCVDDASKPYKDSGEWFNQSPGTVTDKVGNTTTCPANQTVRIDKSDPKLSVVLKKKKNSTDLNNNSNIDSLSNYSNNTWYSGYVVARASCSDDSGSCSVSYKVTGASTNTNGYVNGNTRNINAEGTSTITFKATDAAGKTVTKSYTIKLDRSMPTPGISFKNVCSSRCTNKSGTSYKAESCNITVSYEGRSWNFTTTEKDNSGGSGYAHWYAYFKGTAGNNCRDNGNGLDWNKWYKDSSGYFGKQGCTKGVYKVKNQDKAGNMSKELTINITYSSSCD